MKYEIDTVYKLRPQNSSEPLDGVFYTRKHAEAMAEQLEAEQKRGKKNVS